MSTRTALPSTRRPQWGSEKRRTPLSTVHARPSAAKVVWARIAIGATIAAWVGYMIFTILPQLFANDGVFRTLEVIVYAAVVTFLTFSALMYLVARAGALRRFRDHVRAPRGELDRHFADGHQEGLTVLIPSYAEEPAVVRKTMWSAALQEYPSLRVVLLLDDSPFPTDPAVQERLDETRRIASDIENALSGPGERFTAALLAYENEWLLGGTVGADAVETLRDQYVAAVTWLRTVGDEWPHEDHVDTFFIDQVLGGLADDLDATAQALQAAMDADAAPTGDRLLELHRRLVRIFSVEATTFERKRYASLSNEPNKAMNLNAYIGLLGGRYHAHPTDEGTVLVKVGPADEVDVVIPDTPYLLTLDADSLLLRDYCLRLVHFLEQPENERVAVTQTPYSSFRGAPTRIERLAGATTDIQHILHQGMTAHDATFWVGANAVIRRRALEDIVQVETVNGYEVRRYVQDRTVIEDTESSIDLADQGWSLVNYPERLSYSATPPDFGSLVVQRRRWANGGLLIMPKFLKYAQRRRKSHRPITIAEWMLRTNYMASLAWASFGLIMLLTYPFDSRLLSPLVVFAALPYFVSQASDLRYSGYRTIDIFRIYGFNLILLPVNLAGVLKSIEQALTGKKIPFARTPKVRNRTATQLLYVVAPYAIVIFSVFTAWWNILHENWGTAAFAAFNATLAAWAIVENIGILESIADTWLGLTDWMWVDSTPKKRSRVKAGERAQPDWRAALYHGHPAAGETSPDYLPPPTIPARPVMLELETLEAPILAEPEQPMLSESEQPSLSLLDVDDSPEPDPVSATRPEVAAAEAAAEPEPDPVPAAAPAMSEPEPVVAESEPEPHTEPAAEPAVVELDAATEPVLVGAPTESVSEPGAEPEVFRPTYAIAPAYGMELVPDLWMPGPEGRVVSAEWDDFGDAVDHPVEVAASAWAPGDSGDRAIQVFSSAEPARVDSAAPAWIAAPEPVFPDVPVQAPAAQYVYTQSAPEQRDVYTQPVPAQRDVYTQPVPAQRDQPWPVEPAQQAAPQWHASAPVPTSPWQTPVWNDQAPSYPAQQQYPGEPRAPFTASPLPAWQGYVVAPEYAPTSPSDGQQYGAAPSWQSPAQPDVYPPELVPATAAAGADWAPAPAPGEWQVPSQTAARTSPDAVPVGVPPGRMPLRNEVPLSPNAPVSRPVRGRGRGW
ncbi:MAG: glycosyltransferase family 2 protein [Microbacterium sp.]|uniref:glycosyltransferase family 2 protein n=1 Tax=Microbacterium sp. TaxID=51671 RepID=UPI0032429D93